MSRKSDGRITRRQALRKSVEAAAAYSVTANMKNMPTTDVSDLPAPHRITPIAISHVAIDDGFWMPKRKLWRDVTIADCFTKFENDRGGAIRNFDLVREGKTGQHAGPEWYDGLIYEMIRGSADFLAAKRDPALEARIDGYISRIIAAQERDPDGYLNTWTQMMAPQAQRWGMNGGDDRSQHDVYNAGMMIEAGIHYYLATGKPELLNGATRLANLMCETMGPRPRANVIPGHSGPEEALVKLHLLYRDSPAAVKAVRAPVMTDAYLELAQFWIDARGEFAGRSGRQPSFGAYAQDHARLAQQTTLEGHAVRAALFCVGIAAAANVTDRADLKAAALRFWHSLVDRKMYISGAAGAIAGDEKLGPDYFLPNDGYMETCAAVGLGFFAQNMNCLYGEAQYIDVLERALYNAVLGGTALSGDQYYYQNPLEGAGLRRWQWHGCPCCPPMFLKMMGALPGMIYARDRNSVYVNLFIGSRAALNVEGGPVAISLKTEYPWAGSVQISVDPAKASSFDLNLRIPGWALPSEPNALYGARGGPIRAATLSVNGNPLHRVEIVRGYACIHRRWQSGDVVELSLPMDFRQIAARNEVGADRGRVAIMRGPVLYCAESADNPAGVRHVWIDERVKFTPERRPQLLGDVVVGRAKVQSRIATSDIARTGSENITVVPFFASANREPGSMSVWLPGLADKAVPATLASRSRPSASHCWMLDSTAAINDGVVPERSSDTSHPRLSWWDHKGATEWAQLDFPTLTRVSRVRVFWFADRPVSGGCDLPQSWRILYRRGSDWLPVAGVGPYETLADRFNETVFVPIRTSGIRVEVVLKPGWSGGICALSVE